MEEIGGCYATTDFYTDPGTGLANGAFKSVKYPKAAATCDYGVSNDGKIAGTYIDSNRANKSLPRFNGGAFRRPTEFFRTC